MTTTTREPSTRAARSTAFAASPVPAPHVLALDSVVSRLEANERRQRALDAERVRLLAQAFDIAALQCVVPVRDRGIPADASSEIAYRSTRAEIATALRLSESTVDRRLSHAYELVNRYRDTMFALEHGEISFAHTVVIIDAGQIIGAADDPATVSKRSAYESSVLAVARAESPTRLRPIAKRLAEHVSEASKGVRQNHARNERCVRLIDREDGMADLIAHLPAIEAYAIHDRLSRISREINQQHSVLQQRRPAGQQYTGGSQPPFPAEGRRSNDQVRADLFADLLLAGVPSVAVDPTRGGADDTRPVGAADVATGVATDTATDTARDEHHLPPTGLGAIRAQVHITVTDTALFASNFAQRAGSVEQFGTDNDQVNELPDRLSVNFPPRPPVSLADAALEGYGPISFETAREVAALTPTWNLIHHHPETGTVLSVDTYRPNNAIRRQLRARDEHCRFPGCRAPAHRCDIDHTTDAALGGKTSTTNLAHLCRGHHTLKHHGGWRVQQRSDGDLEWLSPTGRNYRDRAPSRVRFTAMRHARDSLPTDESDPNF